MDALIFSAIAVGHYTLTPLFILATNKIRGAIEPSEIGPQDFPASVAIFFEAQARALEQIGFQRTAYIHTPQSVTGTVAISSYLVMMLNRATGDQAMIASIMKLDSGAESVSSQYVEFSTHYGDGRVFDTLNSEALSGFGRIDSHIITRLPNVSDPRMLYALHRSVIARHNVTARPVLYDGSNVAAHLQQEHVRALSGQVRCGRFRFSESSNIFRCTIKGAYLMTWGQMWPISYFRRLAMDRRARKTLQEFHTANPTLPPLPPLPA
jgi:hypothetical protein